jgi:hypothetical protein
VHLFVAFLNHVDLAEKAISRFREFGLGEPWIVRARSPDAILSAEVPVFGGLKGLALGADEDRLVALSLAKVDADEAQRLVTRVQLEMSADEPPMGSIVALSLLAPAALDR